MSIIKTCSHVDLDTCALRLRELSALRGGAGNSVLRLAAQGVGKGDFDRAKDAAARMRADADLLSLAGAICAELAEQKRKAQS